jgi:hypothetical protein
LSNVTYSPSHPQAGAPMIIIQSALRTAPGWCKNVSLQCYLAATVNHIQSVRSQICTLLIITNKMQRCTIFFIAVNALHVSGGFSAHHQELKLYTQHLVYVKVACCYRCSANSPTLAVAARKLDIYQVLCVQF